MIYYCENLLVVFERVLGHWIFCNHIFCFSRFMTIDRHNRSRSVVNLNQNVQDLEGEDSVTSLLGHTALWPVLGIFVPLLFECKNQSN